ncbi:MAG: hypothetical protein IPP47_10105 [Bryobacterales bacterium]|nr:hypothetical protein [Bryobacterales bacterium]
MTKAIKFCVLFLTAAMLFASAASYSVTLFQPSMVSGTELKAGEYKLTIDGDKATITKGKEKVEAAVKMETSENKFSATSVRYSDQGGKMKIQEIRLGGTTTKVVFN